MKNYDFALNRIDGEGAIYTGAIVRRYFSVIIDVILIVVVFTIIGLEGEDDSGVKGLVNLLLLLSMTLLPELLIRQSIGMFFCDLVILVPPSENPIKSLLKRKTMNLVEFILPSFIYYFCVALRKNNQSLSDQVSKCIIVRKKFLTSPLENKQLNSKIKQGLIAGMFFILPIATVILIFVCNTQYQLRKLLGIG